MIVSVGLKPEPLIVVARPVLGDSVIVGTTVTATVTVYVVVAVATWLPSESLAVAWIVYVPVGCDVPSMLLKLALYGPCAFVVAIVVVCGAALWVCYSEDRQVSQRLELRCQLVCQ